LIEALNDLRRYVSQGKIKYISADKIVDYLPYMYFGGRKALLNKTATPDKNAYVNSMKKYMSWVQIYEMPLDHCATSGFQK